MQGIPIAWWKVFAAFGTTFAVGVVVGVTGVLSGQRSKQKELAAAKAKEAELRA